MLRILIYVILLVSLGIYPFTLPGQTTEIHCDDGIDNDADGFVDYYDSDCACTDSLFNAGCMEVQECKFQNSSISLRNKWISETLID